MGRESVWGGQRGGGVGKEGVGRAERGGLGREGGPRGVGREWVV